MKTRRLIIELFLLVLAVSCSKKDIADETVTVSVEFSCKETAVKSRAFDEDGIYDVNLWIFAPDGTLEEHVFKQWKDGGQGGATLNCNLLFKREYSFYVIANSGASLGEMDRDELLGFRLYMPYPDGGAKGMPMACALENAVIAKEAPSVNLSLERLMGRLDVKLDRSRLDGDIEFHIMGIRVGNCPKCIGVFGKSAARSGDDLFSTGYYASGSSAKSVYLFENLQGSFNADLCSYIEVEIDYLSDDYVSTGTKGLIYRFYIRENNSYDVARNSIYTVTIRPAQDGLLCEDSWRVDKSSLVPVEEEPYLRIIPEGSTVGGEFYEHYYDVDAGGTLHFELDFSPSDMDVHLREDMVSEEKEESRAVYWMDADGKGFSVKTFNRQCVTMMEIVAGEPLNDSETIVINVN